MWYHIECLERYDKSNLKNRTRIFTRPPKSEKDEWFCSSECKKACIDSILNYTKGFMFSFLTQDAFRHIIRENDGDSKLAYNKLFLIQMFNQHHTLYMRICHRMLACLNGFAPPHISHDLLWNSTVNVKGGKGNNLEADLYNEMQNNFMAGN